MLDGEAYLKASASFNSLGGGMYDLLSSVNVQTLSLTSQDTLEAMVEQLLATLNRLPSALLLALLHVLLADGLATPLLEGGEYTGDRCACGGVGVQLMVDGALRLRRFTSVLSVATSAVARRRLTSGLSVGFTVERWRLTSGL